LYLHVLHLHVFTKTIVLILILMQNQNLLPVQKIHFMHLQQYDKNHCVYLARIGFHSAKKTAEM